jgi:hypothetical protein
LRQLAGSRAALWLAAAVGALLCVPSLGSGLSTEDWLFRAAAQKPFELAKSNLFDAQEVSGGVRFAQHVGSLPWITPEDFHISFWRPLTSLTHHFDYRLFTHAPSVAHAQSLLWYVVCVLAVGVVLRQWLRPAWAAGVACVWWAVDDAHGLAAGWISNRHVLIGTALAVACLALHGHARARGKLAARLLSPLCLAAGLLASESAFSIWGYLFAFAVCLDDRRGAWRALTPHALITIAWLVAFRGLGHGARGSGLYVDPFASPWAFLSELPERAGVLLLGVVGLPSADTWHGADPAVASLLALGGALSLILLCAITLPSRRAGALALGLVLSVLPAAATFPSDRLLFLPGIGALGLGALVLVAATRRPTAASRIAAGFLICIHTLWAPLSFPERSLGMAELHAAVTRASDTAYAHVRSEKQRLVVVDAPDFYFCKLMRETRWTRPAPAAPILCLAGSVGTMRVTRVDPNALRVQLPGGFLDRPFNRLYRDSLHPTAPGDKWFTGVAGVEIEAVNALGAPTRVLFRFLAALEDARLVFVRFEGGAYVPFTPPAVGESVTLGPRSAP